MRSDLLRRSSSLMFLALIVGCASMVIDLPPVSESPVGDRAPGKIVWRDLLTNDVDASKRFYGTLFGWQFEAIGTSAGFGSDSVYTLIRHEGELIGGMIDTVELNGRSDISQWIIGMSVDDLDEAVASATASGGEVLTPPTDLQRRGRMAVIQDREGAIISLLQTRDGDPASQEPVINGFLWDELWTSDFESATEFYTDIAGMEVDDREYVASDDEEQLTYRLLQSGGEPRVGIMPNPLPDLSSVWVSYLRVEDPADIAARVAGQGGRVIVEAQPRSIGGEVAFVAGPSGAGIALQTWPLNQD